jgi:glycosyltransferase involved in cell wall biosynthesis
MIATTPALVSALTARYPNTKVTWIPNGVDRELLPRQDAPLFPGFSLAHVGSLYGQRDITPVMRAMGALFTRQPEARSDGCTIHLVGEMDRPQREALGQVAGELGLGASIKMYGAVPRTAALGVLARSHVAIVAAQGQDMMIPAKLYEAIAISRVVLVLAPSTSATGIEAARLGARVVDPENLDLLSRELESLWAQRHQPAGLASAAVGYDAVARQVDAVLRSASMRCAAQP